MAFSVDKKFMLDAEIELGFAFPDEFKQKMMLENGGEIIIENEIWKVYPIFDKSDNKRINRTCNHIVLETKHAKEWNSFPDNVVAIGANDYGDQLILCPVPKSSSKLGEEIFIWSHETGKIEKIANSINDLI